MRDTDIRVDVDVDHFMQGLVTALRAISRGEQGGRSDGGEGKGDVSGAAHCAEGEASGRKGVGAAGDDGFSDPVAEGGLQREGAVVGGVDGRVGTGGDEEGGRRSRTASVLTEDGVEGSGIEASGESNRITGYRPPYRLTAAARRSLAGSSSAILDIDGGELGSPASMMYSSADSLSTGHSSFALSGEEEEDLFGQGSCSW